jgi:rod shape-determining protein MreC
MAAPLPPLRRHSGLLWVLLYALVPVLILYASTRGEPKPWLIERASVAGIGGAQSVRQSMFDGIARIWGEYLALVNVAQSLEVLQKENARLRMDNRRFAALAAENVRLRGLLQFSKRHGRRHKLVPATVVGRDTSPFFRVVRIRLAPSVSALVKPGQPVVSSDGVVGQVDRVHGDFASVMLLSDARSAIDVVVRRNRAMGILKGLGSSEHYHCKVEYLRRTEDVETDDVVVTSGMDERFPQDLQIGRVTDVTRKQYGLYQQVVVTPSVDFARLQEAFVIVEDDTEDAPVGPGGTPAAVPGGSPAKLTPRTASP